jgi:hypothetical protein
MTLNPIKANIREIVGTSLGLKIITLTPLITILYKTLTCLTQTLKPSLTRRKDMIFRSLR